MEIAYITDLNLDEFSILQDSFDIHKNLITLPGTFMNIILSGISRREKKVDQSLCYEEFTLVIFL
jgi:hypothetical protein